MNLIADTKSQQVKALAAWLAICAVFAIGTFALPAEARDAAQQNLPWSYPQPSGYGWPYGYAYYGQPYGYYGQPYGYYPQPYAYNSPYYGPPPTYRPYGW